jgi:4-hydroxybenzoate polyprenyltransferase
MSSLPSGIWPKFARESIYGRRGIIKINSLWLPSGLVLLGNARTLVSRPLFRLTLLAAAVLCWSFASTLANDLSERAADRAAGKTRWIGLLPEPGARWVPAVFAAGGLVVLIVAEAPPGTMAAYAAAIILGLAYSLRPFRMKERGALGLAAYALSCAVANVLIPWTCFGGSPCVVPVLGSAVFLDKWVNLHFHQIVDFEEDRGQGMTTYAVRVGLDKARRSLRLFTVLASLSLAAAAGYAAWILPRIRVPLLITVVTILCLSLFHTILSGRRPGRETDLSRELPWTYLGLTLGIFRAVPLILFWELTRRAASLGTALAVIAVLLAADWILSYRYRYE